MALAAIRKADHFHSDFTKLRAQPKSTYLSYFSIYKLYQKKNCKNKVILLVKLEFLANSLAKPQLCSKIIAVKDCSSF